MVDSRCRICGLQGETAIHVVRDCWWAKGVASNLGIDMSMFVIDQGTPADWIWLCAARMSNEEFRSFLIAIWLCWKNRNKLWHDQKRWGVDSAVIIGKSILSLADSSYCPNPLENVNMSGVWTPPSAGTIKINSDGSWDAESRMAGIGVVARDYQGVVHWVAAKFIDFCATSNEAEGRALLEGMQLAFNNGFRKVIFEVDSLEVYKAVSVGAGEAEWSIHWLGTALDLLKSFPGWKVQVSSRECNHIADVLAHKARWEHWSWSRFDANPWCILGSL